MRHGPVEVSKDGVADGGGLGVGRDEVLPFNSHGSPHIRVVILHFLAGVGVVALEHLAQILHGEGMVVVVEAKVDGLRDAGTVVLVLLECAKKLECEFPVR